MVRLPYPLPATPASVAILLLAAACHAPTQGDAAKAAPAVAHPGGAAVAEASAATSAEDARYRARVVAALDRDALALAVSEARAWSRTRPESSEAWSTLARCLMDPDTPPDTADRADALAAAERAVEVCTVPTAELLITLGTARYLADQHAAALAAFEQALDLAPATLGCRDELAAWVAELRAEARRQ